MLLNYVSTNCNILAISPKVLKTRNENHQAVRVHTAVKRNDKENLFNYPHLNTASIILSSVWKQSTDISASIFIVRMFAPAPRAETPAVSSGICLRYRTGKPKMMRDASLISLTNEPFFIITIMYHTYITIRNFFLLFCTIWSGCLIIQEYEDFLNLI